jgi:hypothetical protein
MEELPIDFPDEPEISPVQESPDEEWLKLLRELRVEIQDFQHVLSTIKNGETTPKVYTDYIIKTRKDISALMVQITNGDPVRHLHNLWEQMLVNPLFSNPEVELDPQNQLHQISILDAICKKIVYKLGVMTIPYRLEKWLRGARPGYYVPFHAVFEDELPDLEDRLRLLNFLAWQPRAISQGLVNASNGLIYRYSKRRWPSHLLLVGAFILSFGLVAGGSILPIEGWPYSEQNIPAFLVGWAALLIGILVHNAIGSIKRAQTQGERPPIIAIGDLPLHFNAKAGQLLLKLLMALIGFFGFVFSTEISNVTPLNLFLVGYGLDSIVEVFGASFEKRAAAHVSTIKQQFNRNTD